MYFWRITKYNPKNRDQNGFYQKNEWTSVSDIGKTFDDGVLTFDDYLLCENAYIDAIVMFMHGNNVEFINIEGLEEGNYIEFTDFSEPYVREFYRSLRNDMLISKNNVAQLSKFILRELVWCKLTSDRMFVHFGYDYYVYVGSEQPLENVINIITNSGLFVEPFISPYINDKRDNSEKKNCPFCHPC